MARQVLQHLGDTEKPHGHGHKTQTVAQGQTAKGKALFARNRIHADAAGEQPQHSHDQRLEHRSLRKIGDQSQTGKRQREIFRRPEPERRSAKHRREKHEPDHAERSGDKRAESGDAQRRARAALARHTVTVETSNYRRRLAGDID